MVICIPRFFPAVLQGFFCFEINSLKQVCEEEYNAGNVKNREDACAFEAS